MLKSFSRSVLAAALVLGAGGTARAANVSDARLRALVRWDLGASLPQGPTPDPIIRSLLAYRTGNTSVILVCLSLTFDEPEAGEGGAVLQYAPDQSGSLRLVAAPFFYGPNWLRGSVPPADACDAARTAAPNAVGVAEGAQ